MPPEPEAKPRSSLRPWHLPWTRRGRKLAERRSRGARTPSPTLNEYPKPLGSTEDLGLAREMLLVIPGSNCRHRRAEPGPGSSRSPTAVKEGTQGLQEAGRGQLWKCQEWSSGEKPPKPFAPPYFPLLRPAPSGRMVGSRPRTWRSAVVSGCYHQGPSRECGKPLVEVRSESLGIRHKNQSVF